MLSTLTIVTGPDAGRTCRLKPEGELLIGRGPQCQLRLCDPGVSRMHCRLIVEPDQVRLEDADSRYGTLVNQRIVANQVLQSGDVIALGDTEIRFDLEELTVAARS